MTEETPQTIVVAGPAGDRLTACARCHGLKGAGAIGVPRLAGQKQAYLEHALRAYAAGERPSGIMQPVAAALTPEESTELAAYFASIDDVLPSPEFVAHEPALIELGRAIAADGLFEEGIPACASCHGLRGRAEDTNPHYPALAGQNFGYLVQQLELWRSGVRGGGPFAPIMTAVAQDLTDEQIRAVAAYYASLPAVLSAEKAAR